MKNYALTALVFAFLALSSTKTYSQVVLDVGMTVSNPTVKSGTNFFYNIEFSVSSPTETGKGIKIKGQVSEYVNFFSSIVTSSQWVKKTDFDTTTGEFTIHLIDDIPAGTNASISVLGQLKSYEVPDNQTITNTVTIEGTNAVSTETSNQTSFLTEAIPDYSIDAYVKKYDAENKKVTWLINVDYARTAIGSLGMDSLEILFELPPTATFVSATENVQEIPVGSGNYIWKIPNQYPYIFYTKYLSEHSFEIEVEYPNNNYNSTINHDIFLSGILVGGAAHTVTNNVDFELAPPLGQINCNSSSFYINMGYVGGSATMNYPYNNFGNVSLDSVIIKIPVAEELVVENITLNDTTPAEYFYTTTLNSSPQKFSIDQKDSVGTHLKTPTLLLNEYIDTLYFVYEEFAQNFISHASVQYGILETDRNGKAVIPAPREQDYTKCSGEGTCIPFELSITSDTLSSTCQTQLRAREQGPEITGANKLVSSSGFTFSPGDTISFFLSFTNNVEDTIINPFIVDSLDQSLQFIPGSITGSVLLTGASDTLAPGESVPHIVISPTGSLNHNNVLTIDIDSIIPGKSSTFIGFKTILKENTLPKSYSNTYYGGADNYPLRTIEKGKERWNATTTWLVNEVSGVSAEKGVKGALDTDYLFYPDKATTVNGSEVNYQIVVENSGNSVLDQLVIVDPLPYNTDVNGSTFTPYLTELPISNNGFLTTFYATDSNICINEIAPPITPPGCVVPVWSTTAPPDIQDIKAFKFELNESIVAGEEIIISWKMSGDSLLQSGDEAYNQFYFQIENAATHQPLLTTYPNKVGIEVSNFGEIGEFVWLDLNGNGIKDEDDSLGLNNVQVFLHDVGVDGIEGTSDDNIIDSIYTFTRNDSLLGYYHFVVPQGNYYLSFEVDSCLYSESTSLTNSTFVSSSFSLLPSQLIKDKNLGLIELETQASILGDTCYGGTISFESNNNLTWNSINYKWQYSPDSSYSWTDIAVQKDFIINNLDTNQSGYYRLLSENAACSTISDTFELLIEPKEFSPTLTPISICEGDSIKLEYTGSSIDGGSFYWYQSLVETTNYPNPYNTQALDHSQYFYLVDSSAVCKSARFPLEVNVIPKDNTPSFTDTVTCIGSNLVLEAPTTNFFWFEEGLSQSYQSIYELNNIQFDKAILLVDSTNSCGSHPKRVAIIAIDRPNTPEYDSVVVCQNTSAVLTKNNGNFYWTTSSMNNYYKNELITSPLSKDTSFFLIDSSVCASEALEVFVNVIPQPETPNFIIEDSVCLYSDIELRYQSSNVNLYWIIPNESNAIFPNPHTLENITTNQEVYLIDSIDQCSSERQIVQIHAKDCSIPEVFFPNGFSPDSDGVNDKYVVYNVPEGTSVHLQFFNRWGDLVYEKTEYKNNWEGRCSTNKCLGENLPSSTYFLVAELSSGEKYSLDVTLIR